jgi:hypothetical protein
MILAPLPAPAGIDVEEGALAIDRDFGDRLGMLGDQVPTPTSPSSVINS